MRHRARQRASAAALGVIVLLKGSPTVVAQVFGPRPKAVKALRIDGETPDAIAEAFVDKLFADHPHLEDAMLEHLELLGQQGVKP